MECNGRKEVGMEDITDDEWMKRMMRNMDKMAISLKDLSLEDWMTNHEYALGYNEDASLGVKEG